MRFPVAVSASVFSIALYFALFWGFDAMRVLTSPTLGLEDAWRSQIVYWIGRAFGAGPATLMHLAAIAAAFKLAVAGVCAAHIVDRVRCFAGGKANIDILEIAILLVVIASIISVLPAIWQHDPSLIRSNTLNLVLASIAAALGIIEREELKPGKAARPIDIPPQLLEGSMAAKWYSPWR